MNQIRRIPRRVGIGIIEGNSIIALRPVEVTSLDSVVVEEIPVNDATRQQMDSVASAWKKRRRA